MIGLASSISVSCSRDLPALLRTIAVSGSNFCATATGELMVREIGLGIRGPAALGVRGLYSSAECGRFRRYDYPRIRQGYRPREPRVL
jgi:hypothetical protein